MSKDVFDRLEAADVRIDRAITLAGAIAARDSVSDDLSEFLDEDEDIVERCLGPRPDWLEGELGTISAGAAVTEWLWESKKFGWLLNVSTPVMTHDATGSTFSWGYCNTYWVYGDTFEGTIDQALAWVSQRRAAERAMPAKTTRRTAKRARKASPR